MDEQQIIEYRNYSVSEWTADESSGAACMQSLPRTCLLVRHLTFNFSVLQQKAVCRVPGFPWGDVSNC